MWTRYPTQTPYWAQLTAERKGRITRRRKLALLNEGLERMNDDAHERQLHRNEAKAVFAIMALSQAS